MKMIDLTTLKFNKTPVAPEHPSNQWRDGSYKNVWHQLIADSLAFIALLGVLAIAAANVILFCK